jgi:hypothetical protein
MLGRKPLPVSCISARLQITAPEYSARIAHVRENTDYGYLQLLMEKILPSFAAVREMNHD